MKYYLLVLQLEFELQWVTWKPSKEVVQSHSWFTVADNMDVSKIIFIYFFNSALTNMQEFKLKPLISNESQRNYFIIHRSEQFTIWL